MISALFRRWHRWVSLLAGLFLLVMAGSGAVLQSQFLLHGFPQDPQPPRPPPPAGGAPSLRASEFPGLVARVVAAAGRARPNAAIVSVGVDASGPRAVASVKFAGGVPDLSLDALTLAPLTPPRRPPPPGGPFDQWLHQTLFRIHTGQAFGPAGTYVTLACGLTLLFLAFSGLWLYVDMLRRRLKLGRPNPFWS